MNKKVASIMLSAAVLSMTAVHAYAEETGSLLVLGDSITTGYGLEGYVSGDNSSAADSFANRLSADHSSYTNLAVDGRTSAQLLEALSDEDTISAAENADDIVISIGGNDFLMPMVTAIQMSMMSDPEILQGIKDGTMTQEDFMEKAMEMDIEGAVINAVNNVDIGLTEENVTGILDKIYEVNPDVNVYILTVYDPFEDVEGMEAYSEAAENMLPQLNGAIENAAAEHETAYIIDVYSAFKGHAEEYTNIPEMDIHPNKEGHGVIYELLSESIQANAPEEEETVTYTPPTDSSDESVPTGNAGITVIGAVGALALAAAVVSSKKRK
ncbi:MAG: SGNH/GDSL hydrolase family protein [Oscillospiraceae bacterium]